MSEAAVLLGAGDAPILRGAESPLAAPGYAVTAVADGGGALTQVERSMPDVLVLDVAMPGLDGLAVTRRLRAKGLGVPILLLTARDALEERVAGLELTRREAQLLELLLRNPRAVITRERALEEVWGGGGEATLNVVDRYVA